MTKSSPEVRHMNLRDLAFFFPQHDCQGPSNCGALAPMSFRCCIFFKPVCSCPWSCLSFPNATKWNGKPVKPSQTQKTKQNIGSIGANPHTSKQTQGPQTTNLQSQTCKDPEAQSPTTEETAFRVCLPATTAKQHSHQGGRAGSKESSLRLLFYRSADR